MIFTSFSRKIHFKKNNDRQNGYYQCMYPSEAGENSRMFIGGSYNARMMRILAGDHCKETNHFKL
jgi:hypothetical protein